MDSISFTDIEGPLGEIMDRARAGDEITIMRDGEPFAVVRRVEPKRTPRPPIDVDAMRALTSKMTYHGTSAAELIREMRDSRY